MGLEIPDALKTDMSQTRWGKVLLATPVVMTVVATMLAGLSSSEMTRAQYVRSLAAQQQSKAGDQWGYFQAKRLRGTGLRTAGDLLEVTAEVERVDPAALTASLAGLAPRLDRCAGAAQRLREALAAPGLSDRALADSLTTQLAAFAEGAQQRTAAAATLAADLAALLSAPGAPVALDALGGGALPAVDPGPGMDAGLQAALSAVEEGLMASEMEPLLAPVSHAQLEEALRAARQRTRALDTSLGPVTRLSDRFDALLASQVAFAQAPRAIARSVAQIPADVDPAVRRAADGFASACLALQADATRVYRDFTAARLRYTATRYDVEARLNQAVANLLEVQVRKNNLAAERHHNRSQRFFYGMLAAQGGVIVATFAMAARQRNLLWGLAAAAGVSAVSFALYVFLYV